MMKNPEDAASPAVTITRSEYNSLKTTATRYGTANNSQVAKVLLC